MHAACKDAIAGAYVECKDAEIVALLIRGVK